VSSTLTGIGCDDSGSVPTSGATVRKAATTYVQKVPGSLSPSSSDSQATDRFPAAAVSSVVLPNPAGAESSVSVAP
jgi:hypothetical protein